MLPALARPGAPSALDLHRSACSKSPSSHHRRPNDVDGASSKPAGWRDGRAQPGSGTQGWGWWRSGQRPLSCPDTPVHASHRAETLSAGAHLLRLSIVPPHRRTATARGSHWQLAGTPRCCGFILQEALELVTRHRGRVAWAGPCAWRPGHLKGARRKQRLLRTENNHGEAPEHPTLWAETEDPGVTF